METIALFGAGGNMGTRIHRVLRDDPEYRLLCIEVDAQRCAALEAEGLTVADPGEGAASADVVIFALPDNRIGPVASKVLPHLKPGAMLVCLDPAAPYAGKVSGRDDVAIFVTHPAHPPVFNDETDPDARRDFFGSGKARQAIVSALMQGGEEHYIRGEKLSRKIFGPVLRSHRVTVEHMALLEPVLSETVAATCITVIREAMDEAVRRGVPYEAARDFLLGHLNIEIAILFDEIDWEFSAGAKQAIAEARAVLFKEDWKKVFEPEHVKESVDKITAAR